MSTKTLRKRIALVAVAALGTGVLAVAPANATTITAWTKYEGNVSSINLKQVTTTPTTGSDVYVNVGAKTTTTGTVAGATNTGAITQIRGFLSSYPAGGYASVSASVNVEGATAGTPTLPTGAATTTASSNIISVLDADDAAGLAAYDVTATTTAGLASFKFNPTKAGTYVLTVFNDGPAVGATTIGNNQVDSNEAVQTISITVVAAATLSAGTSTAYIQQGNATTAATSTTDALAVSATKTAGTANSASITVSMNDSAGTAMASGNTISVTVAGPGYVSWSTANTPSASQCSATPTYAATLGRSITSQAADAVGTLYVCADGAAGVSTISISIINADGVSQALATKTVTFYGAVAKLTISEKNYTIGKAAGGDTGKYTTMGTRDAATKIPALVVKATDSDGKAVTTAAVPTIISSDTAVFSGGTCALDSGAATYGSSTNGVGAYNCYITTAPAAKSGQKATLTIRVLDPADATGVAYLTTTVDVTVGGTTVDKETLSFNKASYSSGEAMVITRTAVDSSGNPVADETASPAVSFTKAVGGTSPAAGIYAGGKSATSATAPSVFAPTSSGSFEAYMTSGNAAGDVVRASATVAGGDVETQIAALVAKINALSKLIAKIQKKLGVK